MTVKPIPEGYSSVTPSLVVDGGVEALDFYERAFGAEVVRRLVMDGKLMHAELRIGDALITVSDAFPEYGFTPPDADAGTSSSLLIYTEDADALYARAIAAGAKEINAVSDQFHGDRVGSLHDPYGHRWAIGTHIEDMTEADMQQRMEQAMAT